MTGTIQEAKPYPSDFIARVTKVLRPEVVAVYKTTADTGLGRWLDDGGHDKLYKEWQKIVDGPESDSKRTFGPHDKGRY